jgi:hypothetical protein
LVGRYPFPFHLPQAYRPLAIDPRTLKVTSFSTSLRELGLFLPPLAPVAVNDGILLATNTEVQLVEPLSKHGDSSKSKQIASCPLQFRVSMIHSRPLLPYKGKLLWPNLVWYRIDPETLKCERLNQEMPEQYRCNRFSISAHYGLVAWRDSYSSKDRGISKDAKPQFFQVKISD